MVLTRFISASCIVPHIEAKNKADALKELTHLLFEKKRMTDIGAALDQIIAREATESTGIGHGIAVPHARVTGMKTLACAIGRTRPGLDFLAIDRNPVHLIFLICYPPTEQTTYLNFVATVVRLLSKGQHREAIMAAESAEEMFQIIEASSSLFNERHEEEVRALKMDPAIETMPDAHADLIVLIRLQLTQEMLNSAKTGKKQLKERIDAMRSLVEPRILRHYDRLMKTRAPALVSVEGDTCQGCFMRLPTRFVQQVRQDKEHIHTCINCSRYIYVV